MIKNFHQVEIDVLGKAIRFMVEMGAEYPHIKEGLFQLHKFFGNLEDQAKAQQAQQAPQVSPEPNKVEPITDINKEEPKPAG